MVKLVCETCGKEFQRSRRQPYCSYECFRNSKVKSESENIRVYREIVQSEFYKSLFQLAKDSLRHASFYELVKQETMKGSYKAFPEGNPKYSNFLVYCKDKVMGIV